MLTKNLLFLCLTVLLFLCSENFSAQTENGQNIEGVTMRKSIKKFRKREENPAYQIMQEVWKHRKKNGLAKYDRYSYQEYEKLQIGLDNIDSTFTQKKIFRGMDFIFDYVDSTGQNKLNLPIFLNEILYKTVGENRPQKRQMRHLLAQKTSGFSENEYLSSSIKNLFRDIDVYENTLNYFDVGFQSPVGDAAFATYNFELTDTLKTEDGHKTFVIRYEPKLENVLALTGNLYITGDSYAVKRLTLRSTKKMSVNFVNSLYTEIDFENPDPETYLPARLSTTFHLSPLSKSADARNMVTTRTTLFSQYQFNPVLAEDDFRQTPQELDSESYTKDENYWQQARPEELSTAEKGVYQMVGRLRETPKFQRLIKATEVLSSGYFHFGKWLDLGNLYSFYGRNGVEGTRLQLTARTYFSQEDMWRIQAYAAYGFKDERWKYAAEARYMFNKINRFTLGYGYRNDVRQLGASLTTDEGIMSRSFASASVFGRGDNSSLSWVQQHNLSAAIDPWKNITLKLDGSWQHTESANPVGFDIRYRDRQNEIQTDLTDTRAAFTLIARPGASFAKNGLARKENPTLAPTYLLKYTHGFGKDIPYDKLQLMLYQPFLTGRFGKSFVTVEAGKTFQAVPLPLLSAIPGNQALAIVPSTFSQMNYYEFITDAYLTAHYEHHFYGKIFSVIPLLNKLRLREVVFLRGAYGTLSDGARAMSLQGPNFQTLDRQIYYEYGFGIENIGFGNLRILRVDFNWRGNYLQNPGAERFGIKIGLQFFY